MSYCSWSGLSGLLWKPLWYVRIDFLCSSHARKLSAYGHPAKLRGGDSVTLQPLSQGNIFECYLSTLTPKTMRNVQTLLHCVCVSVCVCVGWRGYFLFNRILRHTHSHPVVSTTAPLLSYPSHDRLGCSSLLISVAGASWEAGLLISIRVNKQAIPSDGLWTN
jgi:hypothetical protein